MQEDLFVVVRAQGGYPIASVARGGHPVTGVAQGGCPVDSQVQGGRPITSGAQRDHLVAVKTGEGRPVAIGTVRGRPVTVGQEEAVQLPVQFHKYLDSWICGSIDLWIYRYTDLWIHGPDPLPSEQRDDVRWLQVGLNEPRTMPGQCGDAAGILGRGQGPQILRFMNLLVRRSVDL